MMFKKNTNHHPRLARATRPRVTSRRGIDWDAVWRRTLFILLVAGYLAAAGYAFLVAPWTTIRTVTVAGTDRLSADDVTVVVRSVMDGTLLQGRVPRAQYVLVRPAVVAAAVTAMSGVVRDVRVTKRFPDGIDVALTEWERVDLWCDAAGVCALWHADGTIGRPVAPDDPIVRDNPVRRVIDRSAAAPLPGTVAVDGLTPATIDTAAAVLARAGVRVTTDTIHMTHRVSRDLEFATDEGWRLLLPLDSAPTAARILESLFGQSVIAPADRSRLVYIDLRVPHRVFYRFAGDPDTREAPPQEDSVTDSDPEKDKKQSQ